MRAPKVPFFASAEHQDATKQHSTFHMPQMSSGSITFKSSCGFAESPMQNSAFSAIYNAPPSSTSPNDPFGPNLDQLLSNIESN